MTLLYDNDGALEFFVANGYVADYNDGMLEYLREYFSKPEDSLPDLFAKFIDEVGIEFVDITANNLVVGADGIITADAATIII